MQAKPFASIAPISQLILSRIREFYREPEAVFWTYAFPVLLIVSLGVAFRNQKTEKVIVDVVSGPRAESLRSALEASELATASIRDEAAAKDRLRLGKSNLCVMAADNANEPVIYWFDPGRPESVLARERVDNILQRHLGRKDAFTTADKPYEELGGRYVDFLVPGLVGINLMGGGLWGLGYVVVDLRIRKLLKRFLATPMKKRDFLASLMITRGLLMVPEVTFILLFSSFVFKVPMAGNPLVLILFICVGAFAFAGIGLLVASRANTIEAVSGLMNLVMVPMWIFSGAFFSSDRYPQIIQPLIGMLPLTGLINAFRAIMLDGAGIDTQWPRLLMLLGWGVSSFWLALRLFRWK